MPPAPVRPADDGIEPELRAPPPRPVRRRAANIKWECLLWVALVLWVIGPIGYGVLPDYLVVRFGQVVPAEVTYTLDPGEFSKGTPGKWLLAHLSYEWRGARHQDTRRVPSDLLTRFRSHTAVSVKVLRPWQARLWLRQGGANGADWHDEQPAGSLVAWSLVSGIGGLLTWIAVNVRRAQKHLVREGVAVVGRVVRYETLWKRPLRGPLPTRGIVRVHYEYPGPGLPVPRAGALPRVSGRAVLLLPANLPPAAGGPVTVLILHTGPRLRYGLYAASPFEAVPPAGPTSIPAPGNG